MRSQRDGDDGPQRQCVACRTSRPTSELVQLKAQDGGRRGRSAYVCIALECLQAAHGKALGKTLRGPASCDPAVLTAQVGALAQARLLALFGLARRCNALVAGVDAVAAARDEEAGGALGTAVMATDVAARGERKLQDLPRFLTSATLGAAVGRGPTAALGIRPGRLASQAAYWLRVWYATQHQLGTV